MGGWEDGEGKEKEEERKVLREERELSGHPQNTSGTTDNIACSGLAKPPTSTHTFTSSCLPPTPPMVNVYATLIIVPHNYTTSQPTNIYMGHTRSHTLLHKSTAPLCTSSPNYII